VRYLERFLDSEGLPTDVTQIWAGEIRAFIIYLQRKRCFSEHPCSRPQEKVLSSHSVNSYMRSIRAFWSWLIAEGIIDRTPFSIVKVPKAQKKVVNTFSGKQLEALLAAIDLSTAEGFRDYTLVLTLLDTGLRISELTGLKMDDLRLEDGLLKVMGKGGKERLIPFGRTVQRLLWRYISQHRPEPLNPRCSVVFLSRDGRPLSRNHVKNRMSKYGRRSGLQGVRCSPHTLRHTAAVTFLRNGGDVFSLQRLLGHTTLEMTRHYCEIADVDVKRAHQTASPVDNMELTNRKQ